MYVPRAGSLGSGSYTICISPLPRRPSKAPVPLTIAGQTWTPACHHRTMPRPRKPKVNKTGRTSAGILLWRRRKRRIEVLLGHPGGPYFARKDADAWTVLKGEVESGEDLMAVALREFAEETGHPSSRQHAAS